MEFAETQEQLMLREAVRGIASRFGEEYYREKARTGEKTTELWEALAREGFLGVCLPEEYGGAGLGITELTIVCEELGAAGSPLLLLVVSPSISGMIIARFGKRSRSAAGCRASPAEKRRSSSRSPSRTPARTPTTLPPRPSGTDARTASAGRSTTSRASTRPAPCSSSRARERTSGAAAAGSRSSSGGTAKAWARFSGRFTSSSAASGTFRGHIDYYNADGSLLTKCDTGMVTWSAKR